MDHNTSNPQFPSLATRSAILYSVLVGAAVLLAGWQIGNGQRELAMGNRRGDLELRARTIQVRIQTEIRAVANDVRFLAESPFLRRIADSGARPELPREVVTEAEETLSALLAGKPHYAQSRLLHLSAPGYELIRLDQHEGVIEAVAPGDLQPKGPPRLLSRERGPRQKPSLPIADQPEPRVRARQHPPCADPAGGR